MGKGQLLRHLLGHSAIVAVKEIFLKGAWIKAVELWFTDLRLNRDLTIDMQKILAMYEETVLPLIPAAERQGFRPE